MRKELVEQEIERQKAKLYEILKSNMKEPERSNNISRITETIFSLKKFTEEYPSD